MPRDKSPETTLNIDIAFEAQCGLCKAIYRPYTPYLDLIRDLIYDHASMHISLCAMKQYQVSTNVSMFNIAYRLVVWWRAASLNIKISTS